jgi:hypothetical protein
MKAMRRIEGCAVQLGCELAKSGSARQVPSRKEELWKLGSRRALGPEREDAQRGARRWMLPLGPRGGRWQREERPWQPLQ